MTQTVIPDVRWKRWLRRGLLVVSCLCLVLAVITLWLRIQIENTDRFTRTIDPVASDPAIQEAVVVAITDQFSAWLSEVQTRDKLIDREGYLAAPINSLLTDYVEQTARSILTSDEFQQFWVAAKQAVHPRLSALLTGSETENMTTADGTVTLDLAPLVEAVKSRLAERGVDIFDNLPNDRIDVSIVLVDSPALAEVQDYVHLLYTLAIVFPIISIACLGGYLWLSNNRRGGVIRAGLAVATSMALFLVLLGAARWRYLDGVSSDVNRDAAAAFFDIIGRYFRAAVRLIALCGLAVAGVAFATRPAGWASRVRASAGRWFVEGKEPDQTWVGRNRALLLGCLLAVSCLLLITPDRISQDWWRSIFVLALGGLALILLTSRSPHHLEPAPAASGPKLSPPAPPSSPVGETMRAGDGGSASAPGTVTGTEVALSQALSDADRELLDRVAGALRHTP